MIEIRYNAGNHELTISGHAKQNEKGKDIVCSAVSALFYTLAQALLDSEEMLEEKPVIRDKEGSGYLSCKPRRKHIPDINLIYRVIIKGFCMIAENYKKYVKVIIVG